MAKADVNAVFDMLNKVFAGEMEYDEALMNLDYHTAQVRKQWPALYHALSNVGISQLQVPPTNAEQAARFMAAMKAPLQDETGAKEEPALDEELVSYRQWAQGPCHNMAIDEEAIIDWDVVKPDGESLPMPGLNGEPLTLRGANGRSRFQVLEGNPETGRMRLKKVANLA